ncbi:hypothetical protein GCM10010330_76470 [Streptomyces tendae]|nr:hypothetical protein GCM10010330_76470 [Streptomyces tendae]
MRRLAVGAAVLGACAVGLTACAGGGGDGDSAASAPAGSFLASAQAPAGSGDADGTDGSDGTGTASARPSSGAVAGPADHDDGAGREAPGTDGGKRRCVAADLAPALVSNGQEMNSEYFDLRLRNTGSASCVLQGYPGVSLADTDGRRIGEPAIRGTDGGSGARAVTLGPGRIAHAVVKTAGEEISGGACWATSASVIVYPPGSKESVAVRGPDGLRVCGGVFTVGPVTDAAPSAGG